MSRKASAFLGRNDSGSEENAAIAAAAREFVRASQKTMLAREDRDAQYSELSGYWNNEAMAKMLSADKLLLDAAALEETALAALRRLVEAEEGN